MSSDEAPQDAAKPQAEESHRTPTEPAAMAAGNKKRPRLDLAAIAGGGRERKRGKSMFGILVGTLNKAKIEDKERNASEAAKKRQQIEQKLQTKLRKETDSVRRAEEAKKDKTASNRKEEDLQLKDSVYKFRRTRFPFLANFLLTSDIIPSDDSSPPPPSTNPLSFMPRSHPPPLFYLPAILTPAQEAFIDRRKAEVHEATEKEWELFREERSTGIGEINQLRQRVADEDARRKTDKGSDKDDIDMDASLVSPDAAAAEPTREVEMDVDDGARNTRDEPKGPVQEEKKEESASMQADDEEAVEY
ncbi:hypothetical protein L208DRAFT_563112 [Tricholoma matsutake]|nr:hypothetical protein L208DRAFT_563112 [Tricholoma matsutake 945]